MKNLQLILTVMLSLSLIFSGCSYREATYRGQTKTQWSHIYSEYDKAKEQREATLKQRDRLQKKCMDKIEEDRTSYSISCTKQIKELNKNVQYWDEVIVSRGEIIKQLSDNQKRIDEEEALKAKRARAETWSKVKSTLTSLLAIVMVVWLMESNNKGER